MSRERSAGLVLLGAQDDRIEVLIVHPGGPFWKHKDAGAWSIPKGRVEAGEEPLSCAIRETMEELGIDAPDAPFVSLGEVRMKSGKRVLAWAARAEFDVAQIRSNEIEIEWPPRSGKKMRVPEVDRAAWVGIEDARAKVIPELMPLIERAVEQASLEILFERREESAKAR